MNFHPELLADKMYGTLYRL